MSHEQRCVSSFWHHCYCSYDTIVCVYKHVNKNRWNIPQTHYSQENTLTTIHNTLATDFNWRKVIVFWHKYISKEKKDNLNNFIHTLKYDFLFLSFDVGLTDDHDISTVCESHLCGGFEKQSERARAREIPTAFMYFP